MPSPAPTRFAASVRPPHAPCLAVLKVAVVRPSGTSRQMYVSARPLASAAVNTHSPASMEGVMSPLARPGDRASFTVKTPRSEPVTSMEGSGEEALRVWLRETTWITVDASA
jgi:hypothetical protein